MKNIILLAIVLLFSSQIIYGKDGDDIKNIKKMFNEIEQKANSSYLGYSRFQMVDNSNSTEGGMIIAYVLKKKFKKISVKYLGEMGKNDTDFYLKDNKIFFVYDVRTNYNAPVYLTKLEAKKQGIEAFNPKKSKKDENRFYFKDNKLIKWLNSDKKEVDVNSKESLTKSSDLQKEIKRVINLIKEEI
jgi:hypothetical protein